MELIQETKEKLSVISDNEIILDSNSGIYNYKYILEIIKVNCILTDEEKTDIDKLISDFDPCNTDIDGIIWFVDIFEDLVNDVLPKDYCIQFSENCDYGIFEYLEDF